MTDFDAGQFPPFENVQKLLFFTGLADYHHAFLRFGQHYFIRDHLRFAQVDFIQIDVHPGTALSRHFGTAAGNSRGSHILNAYGNAPLSDFQSRF